jgi:hypothetical protein
MPRFGAESHSSLSALRALESVEFEQDTVLSSLFSHRFEPPHALVKISHFHLGVWSENRGQL